MSTESQAVAPPVVAVVVTSDPGAWFEESLAAIGAQDYPNLSVLVIDAGRSQDVTARVAAVLPTAFVRRLPRNPGFAGAANEVLALVEGASHYLFCHDDVAPEPAVVRVLVEEAFRSNAGIVAPKLVAWDDPQRLLQVGMGADKSGAPAALVDRGELDQEQHDGVRDVFYAPGGCTLVRADLFAALGGFDPAMILYGEDLDFSWRAQVAGARVVVAPDARVRHIEAMSAGLRSVDGRPVPATMARLRDQVRPLQLRHRLRAALKCYSLFHLIRVLPQLLLLATAEVVFGVLSGHPGTSRDIVRAWRWNLGQLGDIRRARAVVRRSRTLPDSEVRRLQARGSARFASLLRGQLAVESRFKRRPGSRLTLQLAPGPRLVVAAGGLLVGLFLLGSRELLGRGLPAVGELAPLPDSPFTLLRSFASGWRTTGLGAESPAPTAFALLGLAGTVLLGGMGTLQKLIVLGAMPVGAIGAYRLVRPFGSVRVRVAGLVAYAAIPLAPNALSRGRLSGLLMVAAAPWIVARLLRATGVEPFAAQSDRSTAMRREVLPLGLLLAGLAAFVPSAPLVVIVVAVAIAVGSVVAGALVHAGRVLGAAFGASALAAILLLPWSFDLVRPGAPASALLGIDHDPGAGLSLGAILRFQTGPTGAGVLGWAALLAAALPLVVGAGWRLAWATRLWFVAMSCWGLVWAGGRGWLPAPLPPSEVILAPAAVAVAAAVALGVAAFEADLPGYQFGWRQAASAIAFVALLASLLPLASTTAGGRWDLPRQDLRTLLSWMPEQTPDGSFRVLWIGHPEVLPLDGWRLQRGVAFGTSWGGPPGIESRWPSAQPGAAARIAQAVLLAERGDTTRLGHLLAPMAIRYIVVPNRAAPAQSGMPVRPAPPAITDALASQLDLRGIESDIAVTVLENVAWAPARAALPPVAAEASRGTGPEAASTAELAGARPVLTRERSPSRFEGDVPAGTEVYAADAASSRWRLQVGGEGAPSRPAFGWARAYAPAGGGPATLRYRTSPLRWMLILAELALWVMTVRAVVRNRRAATAEPGPAAGGEPG